MTKYTFEATPTYEFKEAPPPSRSSRHRRDDSSVGSGSLTYSAGSSVHSATGESTDSSFGEIMKVLDGDSSVDIAAYLQQKGYGHPSSVRDEKSITADSLAYSTDAESLLRYEKSVADSLAYSTDVESHMVRSMATEGESTALMGTDLITTVTGHSSGHSGDDQGVLRTERQDEVMQHEDILFSPAEYTDGIKRRKDRKREERRKLQAMNKTPRTKKLTKTSAPGTPELTNPSVAPNQPFSRSSSLTHSPQRVESRQGTPPTPRPPKSSPAIEESMEASYEDDDVWYAKWWMFCFPETVDNATPKR